jgi:hypothetical protein
MDVCTEQASQKRIGSPEAHVAGLTVAKRPWRCGVFTLKMRRLDCWTAGSGKSWRMTDRVDEIA